MPDAGAASARPVLNAQPTRMCDSATAEVEATDLRRRRGATRDATRAFLAQEATAVAEAEVAATAAGAGEGSGAGSGEG